MNDPLQREGLTRSLGETLNQLRATGCRITLLKEVPRFGFDVPRVLALNLLMENDVAGFAKDRFQYDNDTRLQSTILSSLAAQGVTVIDPAELFAGPGERILPVDAGGALYRDSHHLSRHGSMRLKPLLTAWLSAR